MQCLHNKIPEISCNSHEVCSICPLARQHRLHFPVHTNVCCMPFEIIHCDIWGPMFVSSLNGSHFFLTIIDDYTRFTWVHFMKSKSQTRPLLKSFFHLVHTQFNLKIKCLRFDNGSEFKMDDFFSSHGTIHQLTCVDTPQQNAIVECKHQHLLNVARALRFQSQVPLSFWGDCTLTVVHLINRIPTLILFNKSPHEMLFSTSPLYSHHRIFGCLAYISTLSRHRTKFDSRATPCVFIGYLFDTRGYKFFNLHTNSITISRDAIFHERIFPFAINLTKSSLNRCFIPSSSPSSTFSLLVPISDFTCDFPVSLPSHTSSSPLFSTPPASHPISSSPSHPPSPHSSFFPAAPLHPASPPDSHSHVLPTSPILPPPLVSRKSTRIKTKPRYLQNYNCELASSLSSPASSNAQDSGIPYSLSDFVSYEKLSPAYKHFCLSISSQIEPQFYHEAVPFSHWRDAMSAEISALEANQT
jgi:transposase InsO family protein